MALILMMEGWDASKPVERGGQVNRQLSDRGSARQARRDAEPRTLQLQIIDLHTDQTKVMLRLPVGLVKVAQRLGARLLPPDHTIDDVLAAAYRGETQLQWVDLENNERLELTLE